MKRRKLMASVIVAIGVGAVACSSSEKIASTNQPIDELGCAIWPTDSTIPAVAKTHRISNA